MAIDQAEAMFMHDDPLAQRAERIRAFNRILTSRIGVLTDHYLDTPYPLAAVRVVYELGARGQSIAAELARDLELDRGYLSRVVARLKRDGLVESAPANGDRRQVILSLTPEGEVFRAEAEQRSRHDIVAMLSTLPEADQRQLTSVLGEASRILDTSAAMPVIVLREHRPGDMGWVVESHGRLYVQEFGWDARFEALVAEIVAGFLRSFDSSRERCWIAERDGERVGSVFVVRESDEVAKLRLLLVEPAARGTGLGRVLVRECIRFARESGYRTLRLWTNDVLESARRIYAAEGFTIVATEPNTEFGIPMTSETWELDL